MVHVRNTSVEALELKTDRTSQTHRIKTIAPARKKKSLETAKQFCFKKTKST